MSHAKLFVVDDDDAARTLLADALLKEGYEVEAFSSGQAAVERGKHSCVDVVLTDIRMEQGDGFLVLKEFKRFSPDTSIVLLTAFGSLEGAIEAIKQGAYDYLAKPFKKEDIRLVVQRSLEHCRLVRENARFRDDARSREPWSQLVGSSPAMLEVYKLVARVSEGRSTVLLEGESGTGKELIARAVHLNSLRRDKPFIPVNCGALPDHLLESEMFGYEKGAFTGAVNAKAGLFEAADGALEVEVEGLAGLLEEVRELLHLHEREAILEARREIPTHERQDRCSGCGHPRRPSTVDDRLGRGWPGRLEQQDAYLRKRPEGLHDERAHLVPVQPPIAAAKGRNRDRSDAERRDRPDQIDEPALDVLEPRRIPPVLLGREVDDVAGRGEPLHHVHAADDDRTLPTSTFVALEALRERLLELKCDPFAHHTLGIDGVDESFGIRAQKVSLSGLDAHGSPS